MEALLPLCEDEDPQKELDNGGVPQLGELTLHNGTIYRWNRAVYGISENGKPHLRIELRCRPVAVRRTRRAEPRAVAEVVAAARCGRPAAPARAPR